MEEIEKQVQQFRKDYEDGDAMPSAGFAYAERYLKIVNLPDYLTRNKAYHKRGGSQSKHTHDRNNGRTQRLDRGRSNYE